MTEVIHIFMMINPYGTALNGHLSSDESFMP